MNLSTDDRLKVFPMPEPNSHRGGRWRLSWYIMWRALGALAITVLFLTLLFYAVEVLPGDPTRTLLPRGCSGVPTGPCATRADLIQEWGLDKPLLDRYVIFLTNILSGSLGASTSYRVGVPVWDLIAPSLPTTLAFTGVMTLLLAVFSLLLGMRMSRKKGGPFDVIASFLLALPFAVPAGMLAVLALYLFAIVLPVFPLSFRPSTDPLAQFEDMVWFFVLPGLVALGTTVGLYAWIVRDHPLRPDAVLHPLPPGEWREPKKTATERLMGAVPRFLATVPILFPWTIGAVLLGEIAFGVNGAGSLFWYAIQYGDYFLMMGLIVFMALVVVLPILLLADILHYWMTTKWERVDSARVDDFKIDAGEPWQLFRRTIVSIFGIVGLLLILGVIVMSAAAPWLVGPYPSFNVARPDLPPSAQHLLGTDPAGRDVFTLLVYGGQPLIPVAILGFALALMGEVAVSLGTGFLGERAVPFLIIPIDLFLILSVPFVAMLILVEGQEAGIWGPALVAWPVGARLLLLETSRLVPSAGGTAGPPPSIRNRGNRALRLVWGTGTLILADAFLAVALTVLAWAFLGFVGLGPVGPGVIQSWPQMVNMAFNHLAIIRGEWWYFGPPILCLSLATLGPTLLALQLKRVFPHDTRTAVLIEVPPAVAAIGPPGPSL